MMTSAVQAATARAFRRRPRHWLKKVAGGGRPLVVPVSGTDGVVVLDIAEWTRLLEGRP